VHDYLWTRTANDEHRARLTASWAAAGRARQSRWVRVQVGTALIRLGSRLAAATHAWEPQLGTGGRRAPASCADRG
jgi:hypothetical protein